MRRYAGHIFVALTAAICVLPETGFADTVSVRTGKSDTSATITFGWQSPVSYDHEIVDGRLFVRFSREIEAPLENVTRSLGDYVGDAAQSDGGRTVSFALKQPVEAFVFYTGTAVTVELVADKSASKQPEPAPVASDRPAENTSSTVRQAQPVREAQAAPADAPAVGVRTGQHPDYTRVVFDFKSDVAYDLANADGVVRIRIKAPAAIDVSSLNGGNVPFIGGARSSVSGGETLVTMAVPSSATVRSFKSGPKVVVDVREQNRAARPVALPADSVQASAPTSPEAAVPLAPPPASAPATPVETASVPETVPSAPTSEAVSEPGNSASSPTVAETARPRALTPNGATPAPAPAPAPEPQTAVAGASEELSARAQAGAAAIPAGPAKITAVPGQDQLAFRFDFDQPVAAAAFRRGGAVWMVFDTPMEVDTSTLQVQAGEAAFEILQLPAEGATVLRMRTSRRYNPAVSRDGLSWIIDFSPRDVTAKSPLPVNAQPNSPVGARVFIPVPEPGRPIPVSDPNVGDNFVVVPLVPLDHAVGRDFTFPQFTLQPAAQGIVINPLIDDLRVRSLRQGVEIGASGVRLAITNVSGDQAAHAQLAANRQMVLALTDLSREYVPTDIFRVARREKEAAVADSPDRTKTAARMDLAKFFFANAYAPETLGVLRVAMEAVPLLENDPSFRLMRGGSNFLLGRYEQALTDLTHESLTDNDEGRMWAAATTAMLGDRIGSARDLRFTGQVARDYPRPLKMVMGILIAEVSAETGDGQGARLFIDALNLENPTSAKRAMLKFAEGKLMELDGDAERAIELWEEVIASDHRPSRARARVALTELLLTLQRISPRDAIESYEQLRFAWRGDKFEFNNLQRLGGLYLDEGYYRDGLLTLKEAATHFRQLPEATEVTRKMSDTFNALFLEHAADELDPVKAIAIYNEFKELTPAGARGDEMIRNLADKLVEVDLLDRAAELLSAQVQFRLDGVQKAQVGARLALIYALAKEYQKALDVLTGTEQPGLPDDLTADRRHLRARVLFGLKRVEDALALIENDDSENAELVRMEIFWDTRRWNDAANSLRLLVKHSGAEEGVPLTEKQAARIFNYVVALTNAGGERAIAQVRREYGLAMANTTYAEAFRLVTAPPEVGILGVTEVSDRVQEAETFLSAYKSKLKDGIPLSSIN